MNSEGMDIGDFKDLIDSRKVSSSKREEMGNALMKARFEAAKDVTGEDEIMMNLYRFKLLLEDEANTKELKSPFYSYSSAYVDLLYNKRKSFASDIGFSQTQLSLILNGKRPPTDEFVSKIRLHSAKIYQKLNMEFDGNNWFTVYYLDRMNNYMKNHRKENVSLKNINKIVKLISSKSGKVS